MKRNRLLFSLLIALAGCTVFLQCTRCSPLTETKLAQQQLTLVSYNTQTFFDAIEDGSEFKEFKGSKSRWTEQRYRTRLERLKQTMFIAGEKLIGKKEQLPDIVILQEIENNRVIEDLCKQLPNNAGYPYALCPTFPGKSAFTTVILSKYPIESFRVHHLYTEKPLSLRPLTEALINTGSKEHPRLLTVFAVHWKSKSGASESASVRALQESQLINKIREHTAKRPQIPFLVCGDFNQPLEEFKDLNTLDVCWNTEEYLSETENGRQPKGSYYFKNSWEKIDHIFYAGKSYFDSYEDTDDNNTDYDGYKGNVYIEPNAFFVLYEPPLIDNGKPVRYNVLTGEGYSDHLPLGFRFKIRN